MDDYIKKFNLISDKARDQIREFDDESNLIYKKIKEVNTFYLKNLLTNINIVCADISENLKKILELYNESINLSGKYLEKLFGIANENRVQLKNEIDDIMEDINNEPKFWDVIKCRVSLVEIGMKNIEEFDKACDFNYEISNILHLLNLKIIQVDIMQCCLPFSINDYGKYQAKKQQLGEAIKFALGFIPGVSEVVAFADFISIIEKSADIENQNDLEVDFYNEIDDNLKILEQQLVMLNTMKERQEDIVTYFENHCKDEKEKLELLETMK